MVLTPQTATIMPLKPTGRMKWLTMELMAAEHSDAELEPDDDAEFDTQLLTVDGRTLAISAWARETNIHPAVLRAHPIGMAFRLDIDAAARHELLGRE